jgi:cytochrome c peroxidase
MKSSVLLTVPAGLLLSFTLLSGVAAQGFPNVPRTPGELLAGPVAPEMGRAAIVAWHGQRIVTVPEGPGSIVPPHDVRMRITDISDPTNPQVTVLGTYSGGAIHAHAYFQSGNHLFVGGHCTSANGLNPCSGSPGEFFANALRIGGPGVNLGSSNLQRATIEEDIGLYLGSYDRMGTQAPWGANDYWTYGALDATSYLGIRRGAADYIYGPGEVPNGPGVRQTWNHRGMTGNVRGFAFLMGNILIYASDQSGSGVATYDVSNLNAPPVLLDVLHEENPGGYWPEIYSHYIFFPRRSAVEEGLQGLLDSNAGFMVVDFADPTELRVVANVDLPGSNQYVTFQDEYAFMNNYKISMETFEPVLTLATNNVTLDASQFALPVGNLVVTGGYGSLGPGIAIWAHQAEPDTRGPWVAYHVPRPDQTNYSLECPITLSIPETLNTETIVNGTTLILRPVGGSPIPIWHSFSQGKLLTVTSQQPLQPDTTYEVLLTSGIQDAAGNAMDPYSFRFSTGNGLAGGNTPPSITSLTVTPEVAAPGVSRTFNWAGTDVEPGTLDYRFSFGDATPRTDWSTDTTVNHVYTAAGHYGVLVQVRDEDGSIGAFSRSVTVAPAPSEPNSTASATMALDAGLGRTFVANSDNDTVTAIDTTTLAKVWEGPTAGHPVSVARASDGTLWVACRDGDSIDVLSASNGSLVQRLPMAYGTRPVAVCPIPGSPTMLITGEGSGLLHRYDVASRTQNAALALGPTPRAIAVNQAGTRALVTRFLSAENNGIVYNVSLAGSMSLTGTIPLRRDIGPDGSASSRGVPNYLAGIRIAPNGDYAWIVGKKDNTTRGSFYSAAQPLGQDNTVRAQLMLVNLTTNSEELYRRLDIDNSESPTAIAFSPLGDYAFITLQGNARAAVIDLFDLMATNSPGTVLARWETGIAPQGILSDSGTNRLFVNNLMDRTVTAFDAAAFYTGVSGVVASSTVSAVSAERLSSTVRTGKAIFYNSSDPRMSPEGYISCATCHVDGGHDGRTFDFTNRGEGFRNTTDLRGRSGTFHGAVHWSANFDEIQDFENDIRNAFGGEGFLTDDQFASVSNTLGAPKAGLNADLDALAAYVTSLGTATIPRSPHRNTDGSLSASATAGQALFQSNNCATCHVPATDYTDRLMHDVGTLRASSGSRLGGALTAIDTPTLLGIHATAPYLHDGSAATLEDVFTSAGGRLAQAESGARTGGATIAGYEEWRPMKDWQQGTYIAFEGNGTISFNDVQSTAAGAGYIDIRHSNNNFINITVTVNGAPTVVGLGTVPGSPNLPNYVHNSWRTTRTPITWQAGINTVAVSASNIGIDSLLFCTAEDVAAANAHVRGFTPGQLADLTTYLRSLDGTNAALPAASVTRALGAVTLEGTDVVALPPADPAPLIVYTIENTGSGPLNLGQFHLDVAPPGAVTLEVPPVPHLLPGESTTLQLRVNDPDADSTTTIRAWSDGTTADQLVWTMHAVAPNAAVTDYLILD